MSTHTPGPWRIEDDTPGQMDIAIVAGDSRLPIYDWAFVAHVCGPDVPEDVTDPGGFDRNEALSNAHLIAAAPEMKALLQRWADCHEAHSAAGVCQEDHSELVLETDAVLRKTEGK